MTKKIVGNKNADYCVIATGPDVCQVGNVVVPFDSFQQLSAEKTYVSTVRVNGVPTLTVGSVIKGTQGNTGSGIISGTSLGRGNCVITSGSPTVRFCGQSAAFHGSDVLMNNNNVPGRLYSEEKARQKANEATEISAEAPPKKKRPEEMTYQELKRLMDDTYHEAELIGGENLPDTTIGAGKGFLNGLIGLVETVAKANAVSASYQMESQAYGPATWFMSEEGKQQYAETMTSLAHEMRKEENLPQFERLKYDNQAQESGALIEEVGEYVFLTKAAATLLQNGIKALPRLIRKDPPPPKEVTVITKPQGENSANIKPNKSCNNKAVCESDPVNVATGDFIQVWDVLSLSGLLPISLQRTYRSTGSSSGLFGPKWTDNWSIFLEIQSENIIYHNEEGAQITYPYTDNHLNIRNVYYPHVLLSGEIEANIGLFDNRTQLTHHFNHIDGSYRRLSAITDNNHQRIDFIYNEQHQLISVSRNGITALYLNYHSHQLNHITLANKVISQPLVTCQYDKQGYLSECNAYQQNHLWHEYTAEGFMSRWHDTDQTDYYLEYDKYGRAIKNSSPSGYWCGGFIYDDIHKMTTYFNNEGEQAYYYYNDAGLVTHAIDALGRETKTQWHNNQKISETNALGQTTSYLYHYDGNIAQITFPDERSIEYQYNTQGQLIEYVSPFGDKWQLTYDDKGNLTTVTDPQGRQQAYEYSQHGELLKAIQPNGAQWHYEYNQANQLIKSTNPYQHSSEYQSDELGRLLQVTNALNHTTRYQYSKEHDGVNGSLSDILLPDDIHQHIEYDSERRVVAVTDGEGKTTRYRYGPFDLLLATIRPDGTEIRFEYDSLTRLKKVINATGDVYSYERDKAGQIIREVDFAGREIQYRYDRLGRRIATRYPDNHELRYHYDETGLVTEQSIWLADDIEHKCLSTTTYQYNERLQLISATNPDSVVEFEYNDQGHLCCERINGQEITHQWDEEHDILTQTRFGERELHYVFGQLHELTSLQVNQHAPLQFSYNALGQEFLRQSQAGFANSSHYTATGLLAHQRAGRGTESFLQSLHDNPLQPPISTDVHRGYQYDKAFNLVNIEDARWNRTQYRYNANDQIIETQYSNQFERQSEKFQYDNNLNITEHQFIPSDAHGAFLQLAQQQQKGRVTRRITAKGYQDYHYDINGRLTQKVVHQHGFRAKTWYYQWNTLNQLIACFNPEGECWRYTYDAFGRRLSKSKVVDNRPISPPNSPFKNKRIQRVDYLWSGDQMVQETPIYADGTPAYDAQIQWLYQPGKITPTARYQRGKLHYVVTDHQGTPREIFSEKGIVSWAGRLNTWGQMVFWQSHDDYADNDPEYTECHFRFAGQYEDKESGLYYNRFRYYDKDTGQYISPDPIGLLGGFNPYGYVHCPTGWVDPLGLLGCKVTIGDKKTHDIVLTLTKSEYKEAFGHASDVITKSGNNIFTIDRTGAAKRRRQSLQDYPTKTGFDRDEFPMAMFKEGGEGASVRYISISDNRGAGSSISHALSPYPDGTKVKIVVE
ncbi:DUF6531 domain-containing protein [Proteus vulgaris]|uniref:DUF6531 domain-containing protein n=2 Tax=Proteus vulgaris TaxID=585 RepID=UPI00295E274B|nr:DUF6531 domain-containing protein [Proteus vulgaris]